MNPTDFINDGDVDSKSFAQSMIGLDGEELAYLRFDVPTNTGERCMQPASNHYSNGYTFTVTRTNTPTPTLTRTMTLTPTATPTRTTLPLASVQQFLNPNCRTGTRTPTVTATRTPDVSH